MNERIQNDNAEQETLYEMHIKEFALAMFAADRECTRACNKILMPQGADATPRKTLRDKLIECIKNLEQAYRNFFNAVQNTSLSPVEREACLGDLVFRHGQQVRSLCYISGGTLLLRPLHHILNCSVETLLAEQRSAISSSIALSTKLPKDYEMETIAPFSGLDVEDLLNNPETADNIGWLAQELEAEDALSV